MFLKKLFPLSLVALLVSCSAPEIRTHDKVDWDNTFDNYGLFKDSNFYLYAAVTFKYDSKVQRIERNTYVDHNKLKVGASEYGLDRYVYLEVHYDQYRAEDDTYLVDIYRENGGKWDKTSAYHSLGIYYLYGYFIPTHYEDFTYNEQTQEFTLKNEINMTIEGDLIKVTEGRAVFVNHRLSEYALHVEVTSSDIVLQKTIKVYPLDFGYQVVDLPKVD